MILFVNFYTFYSSKNVGSHLDSFEPISFKLGMMIGITDLLRFNTSYTALDLDSGVQEYEKTRTDVIIVL